MLHKLFLRGWLVVLAAGLTFGVISVAEAVTWKMATKQPAHSPEGKGYQVFADKVSEFSGGKMTVKVFPSEQLGKTEAVLEQLQAGIIHVYAEGPTFLQKWVKGIEYIAAEFLFDDRAHWTRFMESDIVTNWLKQAEDKAGIMVIGGGGGIASFMRGPYRVTTTKRPFTTLAEFQGLRLRMHPNDLAVASWRHLGAEIRVLGWTEVYESISRGIVEAVNSEISSVEPMKFYEVAPNVVRHDSKQQGIGFMTNAKAYYALNPELQDAVNRAQIAAGKFSFEYTANVTDKVIARMETKGVTFTKIDNSDFITRMAGFYKKMDNENKLPAGFLDAVEATRQPK